MEGKGKFLVVNIPPDIILEELPGKMVVEGKKKNFKTSIQVSFTANNYRDNDDLAVKLAVLYFVQCYLMGGPPGKGESSAKNVKNEEGSVVVEVGAKDDECA
uniref:Uncharacterized protein n=1 Tax=Cannabis sativa TaxID=3483 RepID=A0A803QE58_CANSA